MYECVWLLFKKRERPQHDKRPKKFNFILAAINSQWPECNEPFFSTAMEQ